MAVTAIIDYGSGNLRSAAKSFERMADEIGGEDILVTADADAIRAADRIVLPGVGAYADCKAGLMAADGVFDAISEAVDAGKPFFGICVGMQLMATRGVEHGITEGFDWVSGEVKRLAPSDPSLKIPHMGWNELVIDQDHPVLSGINSGDHVYFVHSYHMEMTDSAQRLAHVNYGQQVTAIVGHDNIFGTQFHPEKSQAVGLKVIGNFLRWKP